MALKKHNFNQEEITTAEKNLLDLNLLIVGLVRNCEATIIDDIDRLTRAFSGFKDLKWLLVESDSKDQTLTLLNNLKSKVDEFDFIAHGNLETKFPKRTERMAFCRNSYVEKINHENKYAEIDYVVVVDFDGTNTLINKEAVESCWTSNVNWDMCSANQDGPYYDIWTLRHDIWSPNDCYEQYRFLKGFGLKDEMNLFASVHARMITIPKNHDWIEVQSAFGGLAIYKKNLFSGVKHKGLDDNNDEVSDHPSIHSQMKKKGARLYINPKLINAGYNNHSKHLLLRFRLMRDVKRLIKFIFAFNLITNGLHRIKKSLNRTTFR